MKYQPHIFDGFDKNLLRIFGLVYPVRESVVYWREGSSKIRLGMAGAVHSISTTFAFPTVIYYEVRKHFFAVPGWLKALSETDGQYRDHQITTSKHKFKRTQRTMRRA